jgi:hypothetical protein
MQGTAEKAATRHDKALRCDATKGECIYNALMKGPPTGNDAVPRRKATNGEHTCKALPKRVPTVHAMATRCDAELDEIKKEDELYANRHSCFEEWTSMQQQLDALFAERCEPSARFCNWYFENLNGDEPNDVVCRRKRRRKKSRMFVYFNRGKEASQPAFQLQIEDCQTLIDFLSDKSTTAIVS